MEEKAVASATGKIAAKVVGGVAALAIDLAIADKANAEPAGPVIEIEMEVLKEHFGGRTVDKLSDEERQKYFDMVNEKKESAPAAQ